MCGAGFPSSARLLARSAFDQVYRAGHSAGSTFFRGLILSSPTGAARLGITVPKRSVAKAHARNRIKRLVREDFRRRRCKLPALDLVIQARGAIATADAPALRQDLDRLFKRLLALPAPPARVAGGRESPTDTPITPGKCS
ncbi:MAG: ribonuclease P protein component [Lysobacterales bacterium]